MLTPVCSRFACVMLAVTAAATPAQIQQDLAKAPEVLDIAPAPSERFHADWYPRVGDGTDVVAAPVRNNPYTAILETTRPQRDSSGQLTQDVTRTLQARDRSGRVRTEAESDGNGNGTAHRLKIVTVFDPVSHCQFRWTERVPATETPADLRVAFVICGPQTLRYKDLDIAAALLGSVPDRVTTQQNSIIKVEHLPPLQVDGITVNRVRDTHVDLNEHGQSKQWMAEQWYSPDLREFIRIGDDESGYRTLTNIRRIEPDFRLFYSPETFRIQKNPAQSSSPR